MNIIRLEATNVKRLKAVSITPTGDLVIIGGRNGQGKSSCLDSIMFALAGGKSLPDMPVRRGEEKAEIVLDLGEFIVTRSFTEAGGGTLTVKNREGMKYPSPQALLDGLVGKLSFDPLSFVRQEPKQQSETLRGLVGLNFTDLDLKRGMLYANRTEVNREIKSLTSRLSVLPKPLAGLPEAEQSAADVLTEQAKAAETNRLNSEQRRNASLAKMDVASAAENVKRAVADVNRLRRELAAAEGTQANDQTNFAQVEERAVTLAAEAEKLRDIDLQPFQARAAEVEAVNRKIRDAQAYTKITTELKEQEVAADGLSKRIEEVDAEKGKLIIETKFPITGLTVNDAGEVMFNQVPFSQASSAEQLRVSMAIGLAMNPKLRVVLIRDGSLLDEDSLKAVAEMAKETGSQVWLEKVGTEGDVSVIIEDGMVKDAPRGN